MALPALRPGMLQARSRAQQLDPVVVLPPLLEPTPFVSVVSSCTATAAADVAATAAAKNSDLPNIEAGSTGSNSGIEQAAAEASELDEMFRASVLQQKQEQQDHGALLFKSDIRVRCSDGSSQSSRCSDLSRGSGRAAGGLEDNQSVLAAAMPGRKGVPTPGISMTAAERVAAAIAAARPLQQTTERGSPVNVPAALEPSPSSQIGSSIKPPTGAKAGAWGQVTDAVESGAVLLACCLSHRGGDDTEDADDEDDLEAAIKRLSFNSSSPIHSSRQMSDSGNSAAPGSLASSFTSARHEVMAEAAATRGSAGAPDLADGCPVGPDSAAAAEAAAAASDTYSSIFRDCKYAASGAMIPATQPTMGKCHSSQGLRWASAGRQKSPGTARVVSRAFDAQDVSNQEPADDFLAVLPQTLVGGPAAASQRVEGPGFGPGSSDGPRQERLRLLESVLQLVGSLYARGRWQELGSVLTTPGLLEAGLVPDVQASMRKRSVLQVGPTNPGAGSSPRSKSPSPQKQTVAGSKMPRLGDVVVLGRSKQVKGRIRYVGPVAWGSAGEDWVGMELDSACGVYNAFSPAAVLGIRSLPNALSPDYRQQLFGQISKKAQYFSTFGHISSEFERAQLLERYDKLTAKLAQVSPESFVVRGCPLALPHSTTFGQYIFSASPYQEVDFLGRMPADQVGQQQQLAHGEFVPAGRGSTQEAFLRGRQQEMLTLLEKQLNKDWPNSFIKAFINDAGGVVISFSAAAASQEGSVGSYMTHLVKQSALVNEFRLSKDPMQWGVVEGDGTSLFYVLRPFWCVSKQRLPEELLGPVPAWSLPPHVTHPAHGFNRNPFGERTPAGLCTNLNTRLYETTLDAL
eukprot:gene8919-9096_t